MIGSRDPLGRFVALVMVFALLAASCGSSGGTDEASTDATAAGDTETPNEEGSDEKGSDDSTETTDAADDNGQANGEAASAGDGEMGINADNVLIGPAGFTVDLNECPDGWSDSTGVTDTEVKLGTSFVQSGSAAGFGPWADGMKAYFDHISQNDGGVEGRDVSFLIKDDAYEPARSVSNVQELIEKDEVFALGSPSGSPNNIATYDDINEQCVPHLYPITGHPAFGDPVNHPWSVGAAFLPYETEASLWGKYILDNWDGEFPVTVAAIVGSNDFGLAYRDGFDRFIEANPGKIEIVAQETHEFSAPNISNEITTLAASEADVVIFMSGAVYCSQILDGVAQAQWEPKIKITASVCSAIATFFAPAGTNGDGWILVTPEKDINDSDLVGNDEGIDMIRTILEEQGLDPTLSQNGRGFASAIPIVQNLRDAAALDGGLTRSNLLIAARSMKLQGHPLYWDGIDLILNGNEDVFQVEGARFARYEVPEGEELGSLVPIGDVLSSEGETPTCTWNGSSCE